MRVKKVLTGLHGTVVNVTSIQELKSGNSDLKLVTQPYMDLKKTWDRMEKQEEATVPTPDLEEHTPESVSSSNKCFIFFSLFNKFSLAI